MTGTVHVEAFYGADAPAVASGDLVYKEVLREGEFKMTPTSAGIKPTPFRVVREGASDQSKGIISLSELKSAFDDKAYEHVQVPLTDEQGKDHKDIARINTGFVEDLQIREGDDGRARLVAGLRFTDKSVAEKVKEGSIANCSSGIWFNRVRPSDGKAFNSAMRHVALTNTPFISDLKPFGVALSEEDGVDEPEESVSIEMSEVIWAPNESFSRLQANVTAAFEEINRAATGGVDGDMPVDPNAKIFYPRDVWTTKVLAEEMRSGQTFVVPFKRRKDSVELAPADEWTKAEQEWVAASEGTPFQILSRSMAEKEAEKRAQAAAAAQQAREVAASAATEPSTELSDDKPKAPVIPLNTPMARLRAAQEARRERLHRQTNNRGGASKMAPRGTTLDLDALQLSDDQRDALAPLLAENERLREERRAASVESEVQRVMALGLSEDTGFVKLYRRLLLADDGGEALVLSEDGGKQEGVTVTGALKMMIDALPKNGEGKIVLSDQHLAGEAGIKPPADSPEERGETVDEAIAETRKLLRLDA